MQDPRIQKMARLLVHYSLNLKPGDCFMIKGEHCTMPLMMAVHEETLAAGAYPFIRVLVPEADRQFLMRGSATSHRSPCTK